MMTTTTPCPLSARELAVVVGISRGFSYGDIAEQMGISVHTVRSHVDTIFAKLGLHSRVKVVSHAIRVGWIR